MKTKYIYEFENDYHFDEFMEHLDLFYSERASYKVTGMLEVSVYENRLGHSRLHRVFDEITAS